MSVSSVDPDQATVLQIFAKSAAGRVKAGDLKKKLGTGSKLGLDADAADRTLTSLIGSGLLTIVGGAKEGPHPRPNGTYHLTDKGKIQLRPAKPDIPDTQLEVQEAFILLQIFRAEDQRLTRSELNAKLDTVTAKGQVELNVKEEPDTISYHLAQLVEKRSIDEERKGVSVIYTLNPNYGARALTTARQHDGVNFTMSGRTLNALIEAASRSAPVDLEEQAFDIEDHEIAAPASEFSSLTSEDIAKYIEHLRANKYAGKELIPIYDVRRLVAEHHGQASASHTNFDPILKRMRSDGLFELIAINDKRGVTEEQLEASIPGMNEIIFFVVVE